MELGVELELDNREFLVFFKTYPTFIFRSIFKASRSLQTKGASLSVGGCTNFLIPPWSKMKNFRKLFLGHPVHNDLFDAHLI